MLPPDVQKIITDCAREFDVRVVWLFGSSLDNPAEARDIDLAVEGLAPERFFKFYGQLMDSLDKPVDLVDMDQHLPISILIRGKGKRIYER